MNLHSINAVEAAELLFYLGDTGGAGEAFRAEDGVGLVVCLDAYLGFLVSQLGGGRPRLDQDP